MPKQYKISNGKNALYRAFLNSYEILGNNQFVKSENQWNEIKNIIRILVSIVMRENLQTEHLIPCNKESLGFNHIGNIAPCCPHCNNPKGKGSHRDTTWEEKLKNSLQKKINKKEYDSKRKLVTEWMKKKDFLSFHKRIMSNKPEINKIIKTLEEDINESHEKFIHLLKAKELKKRI